MRFNLTNVRRSKESVLLHIPSPYGLSYVSIQFDESVTVDESQVTTVIARLAEPRKKKGPAIAITPAQDAETVENTFSVSEVAEEANPLSNVSEDSAATHADSVSLGRRIRKLSHTDLVALYEKVIPAEARIADAMKSDIIKALLAAPEATTAALTEEV